jgi:hypothetical protein
MLKLGLREYGFMLWENQWETLYLKECLYIGSLSEVV